MSRNFAKTLVWKHGNEQRTPNTNDHHMTLNQNPPRKFSAYATVNKGILLLVSTNNHVVWL